MREAIVDEAGGGGVKAGEGAAGAGTCLIDIILESILQFLSHIVKYVNNEDQILLYIWS